MNIACRAAVGLVVFLPAAVPLPAAAQSGQITGVVVDTTGGVLPGAGVTLRGGPDGPRHVQTDARGRFAFTVVAPGTYAVTVFVAVFGPATVEGVAVAGEPVELAAAAGLTNALRLRGSWSYTHAELSQDSPGLLEGGKDAFKGDRLSGVRIRYAFG